MDALLFNINDKSNGDFFRAILLGNKTPSEIARLKVGFYFTGKSGFTNLA